MIPNHGYEATSTSTVIVAVVAAAGPSSEPSLDAAGNRNIPAAPLQASKQRGRDIIDQNRNSSR